MRIAGDLIRWLEPRVLSLPLAVAWTPNTKRVPNLSSLGLRWAFRSHLDAWH